MIVKSKINDPPKSDAVHVAIELVFSRD